MKSKSPNKYRVVIAFHETLPCFVAEHLKTYLLKEYKIDILFIGHPLLDIEESYQITSRYEYYKGNKLVVSKNAFHWRLPTPMLFIKDMIYTLIWCLNHEGKWNIFFGMDNIDVLVALFLKKIGKVKKVVYYSIDYYPTRFKNKLLNWLYYQFDKICVKFADETWNVSEVMVKAREEKMRMKKEFYNRQYTVPICVWVNRVKRRSFNKINKRKIVYRGSLFDQMGVDLIIMALPQIIEDIPDVVLEIFGDGVERTNLERLVINLKIEDYVRFHGWIKDRNELERLMSDGALGLATFNTEIADEKFRIADPGKIKDYMMMGMPIVTTDAISYAEQIEKLRCGFVIDYKVKDLKEAVIKLLSNDKLLKEYRQNALKFIKQFDCDKLFNENVSRILT